MEDRVKWNEQKKWHFILVLITIKPHNGNLSAKAKIWFLENMFWSCPLLCSGSCSGNLGFRAFGTSLCKQSRIKVCFTGSKSIMFPVYVGLQQGYSLPAILFRIYMDRSCSSSKRPVESLVSESQMMSFYQLPQPRPSSVLWGLSLIIHQHLASAEVQHMQMCKTCNYLFMSLNSQTSQDVKVKVWKWWDSDKNNYSFRNKIYRKCCRNLFFTNWVFFYSTPTLAEDIWSHGQINKFI